VHDLRIANPLGPHGRILSLLGGCDPVDLVALWHGHVELAQRVAVDLLFERNATASPIDVRLADDADAPVDRPTDAVSISDARRLARQRRLSGEAHRQRLPQYAPIGYRSCSAGVYAGTPMQVEVNSNAALQQRSTASPGASPSLWTHPVGAPRWR
jgi:hypothetical protein